MSRYNQELSRYRDKSVHNINQEPSQLQSEKSDIGQSGTSLGQESNYVQCSQTSGTLIYN
jgi:hypothetical protein